MSDGVCSVCVHVDMYSQPGVFLVISQSQGVPLLFLGGTCEDCQVAQLI